MSTTGACNVALYNPFNRYFPDISLTKSITYWGLNALLGTENLGINNIREWRFHDDVIKWKHFPRYWPFVRGIHRSPVNSPHKGQCRGALMFSLICVWINGWVNNREAGHLRRYRTHYDVTVMRFRLCGPSVIGANATTVILTFACNA